MEIKINNEKIKILNYEYKFLLEICNCKIGDVNVVKKKYRIIQRITDNDVIQLLVKNIIFVNENKEEYYPSFTLKKLLNNEEVYIDDLVLIQI